MDRSGTSGRGCIGRARSGGFRGAFRTRCSTGCSPSWVRDRDRALVALWVSTGARAAELLGMRCGDVDPGQQLVTVIRKGSGRCSSCRRRRTRSCGCGSTSPGLAGAVPLGRDDPLWWTRRRPFRPLTYHAARAMFSRADRRAGRELDPARSAAYGRLPDGAGSAVAVDRRAVGARPCPPVDHPVVSDADAGRRDRRVLAHHRRGRPGADGDPVGGVDGATGSAPLTAAASMYRQDSLDVLFGRRPS